MIKKTTDDDGKEQTSKDWIKIFVRKRAMMFGEIKKELKNKGISYASNAGLNLTLTNMIEGGEIIKMPAKPYPLYLASVDTIDIGWVAEEFKWKIASQISKRELHSANRRDNTGRVEPVLKRVDGVTSVLDISEKDKTGLPCYRMGTYPHPKKTAESDEEYRVRDLLQFYGAYVLYLQIQSWNIMDSENTAAQNQDVRHSWLINTIMLSKESELFEDMIADLSGWQDSSINKQNKKQANAYKNKKLRKLKKVEEAFKLQYAEYYDFFNNALEYAKKESEETRKLVKEMRRKERAEKRKKSKK